MKVITESDYDKMNSQQKDEHHDKIRKELIEKDLLKPFTEFEKWKGER